MNILKLGRQIPHPQKIKKIQIQMTKLINLTKMKDFQQLVIICTIYYKYPLIQVQINQELKKLFVLKSKIEAVLVRMKNIPNTQNFKTFIQAQNMQTSNQMQHAQLQSKTARISESNLDNKRAYQANVRTYLQTKRNSAQLGPSSLSDPRSMEKHQPAPDSIHLQAKNMYSNNEASNGSSDQMPNVPNENINRLNISNFSQNMGTSSRHGHHEINAQSRPDFKNHHENSIQYVQNQNYIQQASQIQNKLGASRQQALRSQQACRTQRITQNQGDDQVQMPGNFKNSQRYSNLQNYGMQHRMSNAGTTNESYPAENPQDRLSMGDNRPQYDFYNNNSNFLIDQNVGVNNTSNGQVSANADRSNSFKRANSNNSGTNQDKLSAGPAPAALHSSGGSFGSYQHYRRTGNSSSFPRASKLGGSSFVVAKQDVLMNIQCACLQDGIRRAQKHIMRSAGGVKQPILLSSDSTANCGQCGQFFAIRGTNNIHGRKSAVIKTVREKDTQFKLDDPVQEIFQRMRKESQRVIGDLTPHPHYLTKRVKRIDNLSYIADCLQSDNQTIHHAVYLMDLYSSKMPKDRDYDTILISLVALLISTKYLQTKYPGADALNDMVHQRYTAAVIIDMEGQVLHTIDWQLMLFPIYDYVKIFIGQGCLFENEDILKNANQQQNNLAAIDKPSEQLAAHFRKYAEFFADFCLYQECFMTVDPYHLACAIVAYTRKYMGVAVIWPQEMELLARCSLQEFRELYLIIESKYTENFPDHARSQNYPKQALTDPQPQNTAQSSIRKNVSNQLQLSSGGKTQKTQNSSSNKPATSVNNINISNMINDFQLAIHTPNKEAFDFNSLVSGNKNLTQDKFSHEKFQINSNSVEKFRLQKKNNNSNGQHQMINEIILTQNKSQGMVLSDNKRPATNAHSIKKMVLKNQMNANHSDEKYQIGQKKSQAIKPKTVTQDGSHSKNYSSQKSAGMLGVGANSSNSKHTISKMVAVTSPSANVPDTETEQEVPKLKPMIIKSNSQAIASGYECKTTTKKSPKGLDIDRINTLKESMAGIKMPSSTTNQSQVNFKNNLSFVRTSFQKEILSNKKNGAANSYGALGFGAGQGPIKINQKININIGSNTKKSAQKSSKKNPQGTTSSQKMKNSKSYVADMQNERSNFNQAYQQRISEQRVERNSSLATNQARTNAQQNKNSYVSGKPKANIGAFVYEQIQAQQAQANLNQENQERSILSIKNAAKAIDRKERAPQKGEVQTQDPQIIAAQQPGSKNVPNGLLRRATGGAQGRQESIGKLSNGGYNSRDPSAGKYNIKVSNCIDFNSDDKSNGSMEKYRSKQISGEGVINKRLRQQEEQRAINPPAIMTTGQIHYSNQIKGSHPSTQQNASSLNATKATLMKMIQDKGLNNPSSTHARVSTGGGQASQSHLKGNYMSQQTSGISKSLERHERSQMVEQEGDGKPIQKMIKSGSQVLGKCRSRINLQRKEMNKILNDKKDQISQLVEAAQARCTSNEKTTSTKKSQYQQEIMNNLSSNGKQSLPTGLSQFDLNSANHQYAQQVQQQARMQISSFQQHTAQSKSGNISSMYTQAQERPQTVNTITQMQNYKQMQQIQHMQMNSKKYSQQMAQKPSGLHLNVQSASYMQNYKPQSLSHREHNYMVSEQQANAHQSHDARQFQSDRDNKLNQTQNAQDQRYADRQSLNSVNGFNSKMSNRFKD